MVFDTLLSWRSKSREEEGLVKKQSNQTCLIYRNSQRDNYDDQRVVVLRHTYPSLQLVHQRVLVGFIIRPRPWGSSRDQE